MTELTPKENLTPKEKEKQKTELEQAEDIAYTVNHSIYCTITDFINPPVNAATDGYLRWLIPGCAGHTSHDDHDGHQGHGHHGHHHPHIPENATRWEKVKIAAKHSFSKDRFYDYLKGEFIGDFASVPITIAVQRFAPGMMHDIRKVSEPLMGPIFRYGAERSTKRWAERNHVDANSEQYQHHKKEIYEHEMGHFPQAIVWTGSSLGINVAYQMHADKCNHIPFWSKLGLKTGSVLAGVAVTAGVVVAARALVPGKMRSLDRKMGEHAIIPATRFIGRVTGLYDDAAVDKAVARHEEEVDKWAVAIESEKSQPQVMAK